jgi:bifunctional DNA-binding transcriptional regulator/antitoxin component of YhaV-PrlF toxin-antitoxin module
MSVVRVDDPANIKLPEEVAEKLGIKGGDTVSIKIEGDRAILEKQAGSPVDESFGIWAHISNSAEYVNSLRDEWEDRVNETLKP